MNSAPRKIEEQEGAGLDRDLEEILKLGEEAIDSDTRQFIDEVLKFVPEEPALEYQVFTSHEGASHAGEERNPN